MKIEASYKLWLVVLDGRERNKRVLRFQLLNVVNRGRNWPARRRFSEWILQEFLHRGFAIDLVNVGPMPFINGRVEIRQMRECHRVPGEECGNAATGATLRQPNPITNRQAHHRGADQNQQKPSHKSGKTLAVSVNQSNGVLE